MADNPQAFPCLDDNGGGLCMRDPGMTLRDWFAGQALPGLLAGLYAQTSRHNLVEVPLEAYQIADAMLAEREKRDA